MIHLTLQQLSAYLDGELTDASTELVRRHLSECDACTVNFARIEGQEEILARVLVDEPDDDFFHAMSASIAATIGGRVKPAKNEKREPEKRAVEVKRVAEVKPVAATKPVAETKPVADMKPAKRDDAAPKPEDRYAKPLPTRAVDESALPAITPAPLPVVPAEPLIPPTPLAPPEPAPITVPLERPSSQPLARQPEPRHPEARQPEARRPEPRQPHPRRRETDVEPKRGGGAGSPAVWMTAAVVLVLLGSVAWVLTHRGPSTPNAPSGEATPTPSTAETSAPETSVSETSAPEETNPSQVETPTASTSPAAPVTSSTPEESPATSDVATTDTTTPEPDPTPPPTPAPKRALPKPVKKTPPPPAARTEEPEHLVDRPAQNIVPVRKIVTEKTYSTFSGEAPSQASPAPPPSQPSAAVVAAQEAAARKKLIDDAKRASLRAVQSMEAPSFDDAAVAWEKALAAVENAPEDQALVRRELAQARFQAWAKTPTAARKEAAVTAARAYLMYAPPGPDRDQAWTWLGRLKQP